MLRYEFSAPECAQVPGQLSKYKQERTPVNCRQLLHNPPAGVPDLDFLPVPEQIRLGRKPFNWQERCIRWSVPRDNIHIWHAAGAGKSFTSLWVALAWRRRVVWVTKSPLKLQVRREVRECSTVEPLILDGQKGSPIPLDTSMVIVNYEILPYWRPFLEDYVKGQTVIFDELHMAKQPVRFDSAIDPDTDRRIYIDKNNISAAAAGIGKQADKRIGLTATPVRDTLQDLWSQCDIIEPGCWGWSSWDFVHRYCAARPGEFGGLDVSGKSNVAELKMRLDEISHVVRKEELLAALPPMRRKMVYLTVQEQCRPAAGFAGEMKAAAKAGKASLQEAKHAEAASRKRDWVVNYVSEQLELGKKVVILTGRRIDVDRLNAALAKPVEKSGAMAWAVHGEMSTEFRDSAVVAYMGRQKASLLIGTGECLGTGVNLQDTDVALFVMLPYTPGQIIQWEGRFSRPGQLRPVEIISVIAEGTEDEQVADTLLNKLESVGDVLDDESALQVSGMLAGDEDEAFLKKLLAKI
jgi:superfamily II DNA or RNA helicase